MHIHHETGIPEWFRPQAVEWGDVEPLEHREDGNAFPSTNRVVEAYRAAIDEDEIDLGVRYTDRLDRIFHRWRPRHCSRETPFAQLRRQVVVQLLIEAELARARVVVHVVERGFSSRHYSVREWCSALAAMPMSMTGRSRD